MNKNIFFMGLLLGGCATADDVDKLRKEIEVIKAEKGIKTDGSLADKVAKLEKEVAALKKSGVSGKGNSVNNEKEKAAATIFREVQAALKADDIPKAKAKLAEMEKQYGDTRLWKRAQRTKSEIAIIGTPAPTSYTGVEWLQGTSDISSGTTLVVFWELWCPHCKREVPELEERYQKYKGKGLKIVGLTKMSRNKSEEEVMGFIKEKKVTYPIGKESSDAALSKAFAVSGIPAAALVKDGKIVWRGHPGSLTEAKLDSHL